MGNTLDIIVFICLVSFYSVLPKNADGFGLAIPKMRENTVFYLSIVYMHTFVSLKQVGIDSCNTENIIEIGVL